MKKKKYLKKIMSYFWAYKKLLFVLIILLIISTGFNMIEPFLTAKEYSFVVNVDIPNIIKYAIILVLIDIFVSIVNSVSSLIGDKLSKNVEIEVQKDITNELFKLEVSNFDRKGTDFFIERATSDSKSLISELLFLRYDITYFISNLGIFVYFLSVSYKIFILMFFLSMILFFVSKKRNDYYKNRFKLKRETNESYRSSFAELIRGIRDIKVLNLRQVLSDKNYYQTIIDISIDNPINYFIFCLIIFLYI